MKIQFTPSIYSSKSHNNLKNTAENKEKYNVNYSYNPVAYKDFNITFGARLFRSPENFYEQDFNKENMPKTLREYIYESWDSDFRKTIPPAQAMKEVFGKIEFAQNLESEKFPNMVICLNGELGSGKTIFTKGLANALVINETVTSPTFNIIKEYDGELPLYHMDVYRLDGNTEGVNIEEYFTKGGVVIIEWASTIKDILPEKRLDIKSKIAGENTRVLVINPHAKEY